MLVLAAFSRSHPIVSQFDEHLSRVKSSSEATSSCLSSFTCRLGDLENLFDYTEDLLQLQHIQQAVPLEKLDELLEGYLKVLDVCAAIKNLLSNEKQNRQDLLSALRRRRNMDDISRKITCIKKPETSAIVGELQDTQLVTLGLFKALLSYVNGTGSQSSSWSMLSKIMPSKSEEVEANEFDNVDAALCSLLSHIKTSNTKNCRISCERWRQTLRFLKKVSNASSGA
ncbi:uncharacterized protein LOC132062230 [Lycium ferocissimum]|uniref:uncharacterized protein LOC132062230 n=1 Tax=Lycium ferocissimum TaxID=112874 RepID=UPI002816863D|nr:uncharacterized protein LOC132062230 [Lycium ferocissimum]